MNVTTKALEFRNALLDDQWLVTIQDEVDALPFEICDLVTPHEMGRLDALDGVCDASRHYGKLGQIEEYMIGWNEVASTLLLNTSTDALEQAYAAGQQDYNDDLPCGVLRYYSGPLERQNYVAGFRDARIDACLPKAS